VTTLMVTGWRPDPGKRMPAELLERHQPGRTPSSVERAGRAERTAVDDVVEHLMLEFDGLLPVDRVRRVVLLGHRDLVREVPTEALPEFLHRLARQRLAVLHMTAGRDTNESDGARDDVHA
jgi:hypothetical protein